LSEKALSHIPATSLAAPTLATQDGTPRAGRPLGPRAWPGRGKGDGLHAAKRRGAGRSSKTARKMSLADKAYREIRRRILEREYAPAFQALEQEVARDLGMSRTPVREALVRLHNERLVELVPRQGMRVVSLSVVELNEIGQVLTCVETAAAELLAGRPPHERDLTPLASAIAEMEGAIDRDELDGWAVGDEAFHRGLVEQCGNRRLAAIASPLWDQEHRARRLAARLRPTPWRSNVEHRAIFEAIRRGDSKAAGDQQHLHRERTGRALMEALEAHHLVRV
jgi:DNA-binding GntR family transcriptional regulator